MSCLYEVIVFYVQTWLISHVKTRRAVSSSILAFTFRIIHRNVDIRVIFIYAQKSTATDRYLSSYGPAKFDVAMESGERGTKRRERSDGEREARGFCAHKLRCCFFFEGRFFSG
jgi:hypothetical protein